MADRDDVRRIAMSLPGVSEGDDRFPFSVSLAAIQSEQLEELLIDAWRIQAPRDAVGALDANHSSDRR